MCTAIDLGNGSVAMVCGGRHRTKRCAHCGKTAGLQCDGLKAGKTCDRWICSACATNVGENVDLCKLCVKAGVKTAPIQESLL